MVTERRGLVGPVWLLLGVLGLVVLVGLAFTLNGRGNHTDILSVERSSPSTVELGVGSCNQEPFADEFEQTSPGTYEVLVGTRFRNNGNDCADILSIKVDPDHETITIIDRFSGRTFELLGE